MSCSDISGNIQDPNFLPSFCSSATVFLDLGSNRHFASRDNDPPDRWRSHRTVSTRPTLAAAGSQLVAGCMKFARVNYSEFVKH
jgi:hypothetical protein